MHSSNTVAQNTRANTQGQGHFYFSYFLTAFSFLHQLSTVNIRGAACDFPVGQNGTYWELSAIKTSSAIS